MHGLPDLLSRAVARYGDRPAVGCVAEPPIRYRELDARSAQLAQVLLRQGVRRGDRVGLLVPKSVEAVVGLWGILRAGAAYVPLDPAAPAARAARIAEDCGMAALVASSDLATTVAAIEARVGPRPCVAIAGAGALDGDHVIPAAALADAPVARVGVSVNERDLAYVLYTSGSTGEPKGVMVSHGAALSFVGWAVTRFGIGPTDVLSNHAPLHFDLSTFDLYAATAAGARVVVLDEELVCFPMAVTEAIADEGITIWYSVPSALRRMVRLGRLEARGDGLRAVLFAGEAYPVDALRELRAAVPRARLVNLYGPTETNVCTYWPVEGLDEERGSVPIGLDCENCQGFVVDEAGAQVPDGQEGELWVRGGTLMDGYWGDPERTAAVLVPNRFQPHRPDRLCRTGDYVVRVAEGIDRGTYRFVGRRDHIVKVRGHRVGLGEVEAALLRASGVEDAAVVAVTRDGDAGPERGLVAFLVGRPDSGSGTGASVAELRGHLATALPRYMIPAEIAWLDQLPMTTNGKVDRVSLTARADAEVRR